MDPDRGRVPFGAWGTAQALPDYLDGVHYSRQLRADDASEPVSYALPAGMNFVFWSLTEIRLCGALSPATQDQVHTFTIRLESRPTGSSSNIPPLVTERTFSSRSIPQPTGLWATGATAQRLF